MILPLVCRADTTPANDLFAQGQVGLDKRVEKRSGSRGGFQTRPYWYKLYATAQLLRRKRELPAFFHTLVWTSGARYGRIGL
ncbi:hypothetical protein ES703_60703 [subsurface metagenome]